MTEHEERRLLNLSRHYHNQILHGVKLRATLRKMMDLVSDAADLQVIRATVVALGEAVLWDHPPNPLAHFYYTGLHSGHPFEEYLHLPIKPEDGYMDDTDFDKWVEHIKEQTSGASK